MLVTETLPWPGQGESYKLDHTMTYFHGLPGGQATMQPIKAPMFLHFFVGSTCLLKNDSICRLTKLFDLPSTAGICDREKLRALTS